jgi:hypothetical protein
LDHLRNSEGNDLDTIEDGPATRRMVVSAWIDDAAVAVVKDPSGDPLRDDIV